MENCDDVCHVVQVHSVVWREIYFWTAEGQLWDCCRHLACGLVSRTKHRRYTLSYNGTLWGSWILLLPSDSPLNPPMGTYSSIRYKIRANINTVSCLTWHRNTAIVTQAQRSSGCLCCKLLYLGVWRLELVVHNRCPLYWRYQSQTGSTPLLFAVWNSCLLQRSVDNSAIIMALFVMKLVCIV